jgi:hypothetical protein
LEEYIYKKLLAMTSTTTTRVGWNYRLEFASKKEVITPQKTASSFKLMAAT